MPRCEVKGVKIKLSKGDLIRYVIWGVTSKEIIFEGPNGECGEPCQIHQGQEGQEKFVKSREEKTLRHGIIIYAIFMLCLSYIYSYSVSSFTIGQSQEYCAWHSFLQDLATAKPPPLPLTPSFTLLHACIFKPIVAPQTVFSYVPKL